MIRAADKPDLTRAGFTAPGPVSQKFLRRLFQKAATSFSYS
jgi:hypothetical protein